jgi:DNA-directed RNA polymerase subunit RPC12/RpoP
MGADGELYCGRCGREYLRPIDPGHCSACGREIGAAVSRSSLLRFQRYLCLECAGRAEWE